MRSDHRFLRFARRMRRVPTRAEQRLWRLLRDRQFLGCKFRRQYPAGCYILDFYCAELRLSIELDGKHHESPWMSDYDSERSRYLRTHDITTLRIPNALLIRDAQLVFEQISFAIDSLRKP